MSRMIDADAFDKTLEDAELEAKRNRKYVFASALNIIRGNLRNAPTIEERKTGKWIFIGNQMFECSECGTCYTQSQFHQMRVRISDPEFPKFCPNCGDAK